MGNIAQVLLEDDTVEEVMIDPIDDDERTNTFARDPRSPFPYHNRGAEFSSVDRAKVFKWEIDGPQVLEEAQRLYDNPVISFQQWTQIYPVRLPNQEEWIQKAIEARETYGKCAEIAVDSQLFILVCYESVSYTHLRAHET